MFVSFFFKRVFLWICAFSFCNSFEGIFVSQRICLIVFFFFKLLSGFEGKFSGLLDVFKRQRHPRSLGTFVVAAKLECSQVTLSEASTFFSLFEISTFSSKNTPSGQSLGKMPLRWRAAMAKFAEE